MTPLYVNSKTLQFPEADGGCWGWEMRSCCSMGRVSGPMSEF